MRIALHRSLFRGARFSCDRSMRSLAALRDSSAVLRPLRTSLKLSSQRLISAYAATTPEIAASRPAVMPAFQTTQDPALAGGTQPRAETESVIYTTYGDFARAMM